MIMQNKINNENFQIKIKNKNKFKLMNINIYYNLNNTKVTLHTMELLQYVYEKSWDIHLHLKKKLNIMKKVYIFCHSFQKVKSIYYIDSFT